MINTLQKSIDLNLFDPEWYAQLRGRNFSNSEAAFHDYVRLGVFSDVSPSPNFDGMQYLKNNSDVYLHQMNPLLHYINHGMEEGRLVGEKRKEWVPASSIEVVLPVEEKKIDLAIVLHIYYEDYVAKYAEILSNFFTEFTLYVTTPFDAVADKAKKMFGNMANIKNLNISIVPNKGRNFGPFLVEFSQDILNHEYMIHLHSKKSLHSGREQSHWSNYLTEYLLADQVHIRKVIEIFDKNKKYGLFYPKSFWNMPSWVNHWLKNKAQGVQFIKNEVGVDCESDFFAYPVGGMFICRVKAFKKLLQKKWSYDDWPEEPLPADGTILHVLERALPFYAKEAGYDQFFFDARTGLYTDDESFIFSSYLNDSYKKLKATVLSRPVVSFDIFDTLLCRDTYHPDLHKKKVPQRLGLKISGDDYHLLRDSAESSIRRRNGWSGDVDLFEICEEVALQLDEEVNPKILAETEFLLDFERIQPKQEMVEILNNAIREGKKVLIVSDTYYTELQIEKILRFIGVHQGYQLFISSNLKLRKDRGDLWDYIAEDILKKRYQLSDLSNQFVHIGDNVCADAQNVGDRKMGFFHILNSKDKWQIFEKFIYSNNFIKDENYWKYYGPLMTAVGRNSFL